MEIFKTLTTMQIIYYAYGALAFAYVVYKTLDPRKKNQHRTAIGRFFIALITVALVSGILGFIGPMLGLYSLQTTFFTR